MGIVVMPIELLLVLTAIIELLCLLQLTTLSKEWHYSFIGVNLVLVCMLGGKLIEVGGFVTNAGNIFYASAFLATHLLSEQHGRRAALKSVWFGGLAILFLALMTQLTISTTGVAESRTIDRALYELYGSLPRVAFAAGVAYVIAQRLHIEAFELLKRTKWGYWVRANAANIFGQLLDSLLFFGLAFAGTMSVRAVVAMGAVGLGIKVLCGLLLTPLIAWRLRGRAPHAGN